VTTELERINNLRKKPECQQFRGFSINLPHIKTSILLTDSHIFLEKLVLRIYCLIKTLSQLMITCLLNNILMLSGEFRL